MHLFFFEPKGSSLAVILVAAVFLISVFLGVSRGKSSALAESSLSQTQEMEKGLDNFYKDQNRFPTEEELVNTNIALTYFSSIPNNSSQASVCPQNFLYSRLSITSYQLNFCLAADTANYKQGWNQVIEQKQ
jgi:hypothetical protein